MAEGGKSSHSADSHPANPSSHSDIGSLSDQSSETDESSSTDSDSIAVSDETEMKCISDTIMMFPQRCLTKCKNVYQGEISSRVLRNRQCAIKFPQDTDQSNKEVKILEKLGLHTHVIALIQSGVVDSIFNDRFLVLELCCKENLDQYLRNTPYDLQLSLGYCIQIIEGMKYIHDKSIIHKDLKPSNILLTLDQRCIEIADFGISQEIKSKRSMFYCENRFGTVGYRPPESFENAFISLKSDNFSLGALYHYILSDGKSSFGPVPDLWDSNVIKGNVDIANLLVPNPNTFSHLLKLMMSKERRCRPTIWEIEDHPCWRLEEKDCEFDYGCMDEIEDSSDERAHSPRVEDVDPIDEIENLSEMLKILEPEEKRIRKNKGQAILAEGEHVVQHFENAAVNVVAGDQYNYVQRMQKKTMRPSEIRFSQDSISSTFTAGDHINMVANELCTGHLDEDDFTTMEVFINVDDGHYYTRNNRMLYVFRVAEYRECLDEIHVNVDKERGSDRSKFTTKNDGITVDVEGGATVLDHFDFERESMRKKIMRPSEIRFCRDSISSAFIGGDHVNRVANDLCTGHLDENDFPTMEVFMNEDDGHYYTRNNRMLYVFRVAEYRQCLDEIHVNVDKERESDRRRFTTQNDGITVAVRGGARVLDHFDFERWNYKSEDNSPEQCEDQ